MARVVALVPDLLFGSKVLSMLKEAGHQVALVRSEGEVRDGLGGAEVLVVDLTVDDVDGIELVSALKGGGEMQSVKTLGFYSHVDADIRDRALAAGFDTVVPRSRMAREGGALVSGLAL